MSRDGGIAGITVEIGGDTTKLSKALSGVNKEIKETQIALKDVNKLLKIDPRNTELLRQKQNDLKNAIQETKDKLKSLQDAVVNSVYGMNDAATATLNFARAGLDAGQAADALAPAMNLAAGEGGNLDTVSAGLVATINGFHGAFSEAGKYADVFAAACNNSALDVDSLSNAMSVALPSSQARVTVSTTRRSTWA